MASLTGVYFRRNDYPAFWRRLLIDSLDLVVIGVVCPILLAAVWMISPSPGLILASWGTAFFCYFVLLKRSRLRTIGYRSGARIVGHDGGKPDISSLRGSLTPAPLPNVSAAPAPAAPGFCFPPPASPATAPSVPPRS